MSSKSFFSLLIKIVGIFLAFQSISVVFGFFTTFPYLLDSEATLTSITISGLLLICVLMGYGLIVYYCLFQTELVVAKLALTDGLEQETVGLVVDQTNLLKLIFYVTVILILVDSIPYLCKQVFEYFQERYVHEYITQNPSTKYIVYHGAKIVIGYLLIKENKRLVLFCERTNHN